MKNFYSIYLDTRKKDLMKPNGLIPYTLHKEFGYNATIVTYNNDNYDDENIKGVNVDIIKKRTGKPIIDASMYIIKNAKNIDILHTFFWKKENYIWFSLYKFFNPKGKIYVTMDADERLKKDSMKNKGVKGRIKKAFLKKCDLISTETKEMHSWLKQNWYEEIKYIPYGVLTSREQIKYVNKENTILTVGRIGTYQKATEILLQAYEECYKQLGNWKLKIIGPIEDEFKQEINKYYEKNINIKDFVEFTGPIFDREKLMEEFEKAKIFCLTSRYESFGLVLSEAGSRGCYIISSDIPPARDLTDNEKYGTLFEIDNAKELSQKIVEICKNQEKIAKNCERVQSFINKDYSWKSVCKKALKYLCEEVEDEV